ncbi:MAG: acyl-CoA dehydrogenase family protein [Pseudomonadota bacterium]|nr:acyl-CoA dehydrogenase family protein [Pseudomonadota bacterium]
MTLHENIDRILPAISARAAETEAARRLPADLAASMAEAGLFRMMVPQAVGGLECSAAESLRVMERVAKADAAAGWCVMISATSAFKSGFVPEEVARQVYGQPGGIFGGVFAPMGRAVPEGDGYRLTGRWSWCSGSANCTWFSGGAVIMDDGKPRLLPNGAPDSRMMIFPMDSAELIDTWMAAGLAGTGSGDVAVKDIFVPATHAVSLMHDGAVAQGPLYRFPTFGLLALGIAAVALGNAAAAIDDLVDLAGAKKPAGGRRTLAERGMAQAELAQASAKLRSARAFAFEAVDRAWVRAEAGGELDTEMRADLRLAATHATRTAADVTRAMYDLGGGNSLFLTSPLQRRFRDAHAMTQHMMVAPSTWELTGRVAMGLPTDATFL